MKYPVVYTAGIGLLFFLAGCNRHAGLGLGLDVMKGGRDTASHPSAVIEQKTLSSMKLLSIPLEAKNAEETGKMLNAGYIELCTFVNRHRLTCGKVMAFYYTYKAPFVLEAALEVDSIPPLLTGNIKSRLLEGGDVLIVHYKGPYESASFAYHALEKWLKDNGKQPRGIPFEVYLNDPITIKDQNKLLTDIYQLIQ